MLIRPQASAQAPINKSSAKMARIFLILLTSWLLMMNSSLEAARITRVILDPGHGGRDLGGKSGLVFEKHLALDTSYRIKKLLENHGLTVELTRSRDRFIELEERARKGNKPSRAIFVSIHYNYTSRRSVTGAETFYYYKQSYPLAKYIQRGLVSHGRTRNRGIKRASFHVIRGVDRNPSVLVECGFLSNSNERDYCCTGSHRQRIAEGIAKGVLAYRHAVSKGRGLF